jgi:hypothetical protein
MYQGVFKESFPTKYGHGVKVTVAGGNEWTIFGKGEKPQFALGTILEFEAEQKGKTWAYSQLRVAAPPAAPASASPAPVAPSPYAPQPAPVGAAMSVNPDKDRDMFVTGVVGRAMGSGQFGVNEISLLTLAAEEAWGNLLAKRAGRFPPKPAHAPSQNDGPPMDDPRFH